MTLEHEPAGGMPFGPAPLLLVRHLPRLAAGRHHAPAVHELVQHQVRDRAASAIWEGAAALRFYDSPAHELHALAPTAVGRGYRYTMALTIDDQIELRDLRAAGGWAVSEQKVVIVVDPGLPLGLLANTVAYLALTLGQRLPSQLGPDVADGSGLVHRGTGAVPLPILAAAAAQLATIHRAAAGQPELLALSFTDAAQLSQTYAAYLQAIAARPTRELVYLGVALAGPRRQVSALTGSLPLLRR